MVANPILFPLVKPFRASWSGKPFFVQFLTADNRENKASVRSEDFTEYPIWHKLWKAAGKSSVRKRQRHLKFLPSAVPLHDKTSWTKKLQWFSRLSRLGLQGKELVLTGHLKYIPQKVRVTQYSNNLEDELPENRCRCENLQSEAKWSLAGSLYGNVLEFPFAAKANQPSFAWCHGHGAKRMVHPSQKVVTSGIA